MYKKKSTYACYASYIKLHSVSKCKYIIYLYHCAINSSRMKNTRKLAVLKWLKRILMGKN